jgi:hypothetical protein
MAKYNKIYTFADGVNQTASGAQVNTELVNVATALNAISDEQIDASANIAISKTALGTYTAPTSWDPTETGFSGAGPTATAYYAQLGKIGFIWYNTMAGAGISNATTFTITNLPLAPQRYTEQVIRFLNNGSWSGTPGLITIAAGATTATLCTDMAGGTNWAAANEKGANFFINFPVA